MTKELEISFIGKGEVKGFIFSQVQKTDTGYIYLVNTNGSEHYEVFERKEVPVCLDFAKRIYSESEAKVTYPSSRDFGVTAWLYPTLSKAENKLKNIAVSKQKAEVEAAKELIRNNNYKLSDKNVEDIMSDRLRVYGEFSYDKLWDQIKGFVRRRVMSGGRRI